MPPIKEQRLVILETCEQWQAGEVNELLKQGWRVVPGTIVIGTPFPETVHANFAGPYLQRVCLVMERERE